jgi:hypothetical protein
LFHFAALFRAKAATSHLEPEEPLELKQGSEVVALSSDQRSICLPDTFTQNVTQAGVGIAP